MEFYSVLFPTSEDVVAPTIDAPLSLKDLHLDQLFAYIFDEKYEYNLREYYFTQIQNPEIITYRQEILKDLLNEKVRGEIKLFSEKTGYLKKNMDNIREGLNKMFVKEKNYLIRGSMLESAEIYTEAINNLVKNLDELPVESRGLLAFKEYLREYAKEPFFIRLSNEVKRVREIFDGIHYNLYIKGGAISVCKYDDEISLTDEITELFAKFQQEDSKKALPKLKPEPYQAIMENNVLIMLAKVYHKEFNELENFCIEFQNFDSAVLLRFSREIQFYLSWYEITENIRNNGMPFTLPKVSLTKEHMYAKDFYDVMLAFNTPSGIVTNSIDMNSPEHILVITGPNQGGKTTFARAFGQMHYLASIGLDIPGTDAALFLCDQILTHFEVEETIETLNGKLQDELERLYELKSKATPNSVILINEIFASTTASDAIQLGGHMMGWLEGLGAVSIVVTFLDELATYSSHVVSLMTEVKSKEDHTRTYKLVRKAPDGHAYAMDIAEKYGLSKDDLERRLSK